MVGQSLLKEYIKNKGILSFIKKISTTSVGIFLLLITKIIK